MTKEKALACFKKYPLHLWYENKANLFSLFLASDARTGTLKEILGTTYKPFLNISKNRVYAVYANKEDQERIAKVILKKMQEDKAWFAHAVAEIYSRAEALLTFSRVLKTQNYSAKSNQELCELYSTFVHLFKTMRVYSSIPTMLEHDTPVLTNFIKKQLEKYIPQTEQDKVFALLTTPSKKSYLFEEELERLSLAEEVQKSPELLNIFKKNAKEAWQEISKTSLDKKIIAHTHKWCWKEYMFEGTPLTEVDFVEQIIKDLQENPALIKKQRQEKHAAILHEQQKTIREYHIPSEINEWCVIGQHIVYLKYFRKGVFAESYDCVEFLLKEIAQRLGVTLEEVREMTENEIVDAMLHNKQKKTREIEKRLEYGAYVSYEGKTYVLTKKEAEEILKQNLIEEKVSQEINGQIACAGIVEGIVCVVNSKEDMKNMSAGNVLVSVMTNPDLFPALKKASAVITDIGGLSCHAAIVARELCIPCIIGTKHASKILKTGDKVHVDANAGTVTIVNRK